MPQTAAALVAIWRATVGASSMAGAPALPYGTSALRGRGPVPRAIIRSSGALVIELVSPPDCFLQESRHDPLRMPAPEARPRLLRSPVIIPARAHALSPHHKHSTIYRDCARYLLESLVGETSGQIAARASSISVSVNSNPFEFASSNDLPGVEASANGPRIRRRCIRRKRRRWRFAFRNRHHFYASFQRTRSIRRRPPCNHPPARASAPFLWRR